MFYPDNVFGMLLLANGTFALLMGAYIILKDKNLIQNRLMGISFTGFSFYLIFESFIYILQSQDESVGILRDLSLLGVMVGATMIFLTSIYLTSGASILSERKNLIIGFIIINILFTIVAMVGENISFSGTDPVIMEFEGTLVSLILSHVYPIILICVGIIYLYFLYRDSKHDKDISNKILLLIISIVSILLGALWMTMIRALFINEIVPPLLYIPGHLFYLLGSIFVFLAFRKKQ